MRLRTMVTSVLALGILPSTLHAQQVVGYTLTVRRVAGPSIQGELLAVTHDSLWLREDSGVRALGLNEMVSGWVPKADLKPGRALYIGLGVGLLSGALLTGACNSVADGCGSVLFASALSGLVIGGLSALSLRSGSRRKLAPDPAQLAPYARFPQGPPRGLDFRSLGVPPVPR